MQNRKGQVSTEYLVILAVVLVIALVVVYLISSQSSGAASALKSTSKTYWRAQSPLAVSDFVATGTTLSVTMKNMDPQKITVTAIDGTGIAAYSTSTTFNVGQERQVNLTLDASCGTSGSTFEFGNVTMTYSKSSTTGLVQVGDRPLIGRCT